MHPQPHPVDPVDIAYERIFLELPTREWRRYDFKAMSHAERTAAAMLVKAGAAELRLRCRLRMPGSKYVLRVVAVALGDYLTTSRNGQSLVSELRSGGHCLPDWNDSPLAIINAHKVALRLTADGERARELHCAGIPGALWNIPFIVPGQVVSETVKLVTLPEAPTTSPPAQATANASVGDIHLTVNLPPPEVVIVPASTDVSPETGEVEVETELPEPLFAVEHWSQLAIGIDSHWQYWAKKPAPAPREEFKKSDASKLDLPGDRWKTLLELLAESPSGNSCDAAALIQKLGYLPPTSSLPSDRRARPGSLECELTSDLPKQIAASLERLKGNVGDLGRDLRKQIEGPKGRDWKAALRVDGQTVRSGFVVGFLVPDEHGHLAFRHDLSESG